MSILDRFRKKEPPKKVELDPRIEELKRKIEPIIMSAENEGRFSFFEFNEVQMMLKRCEQINDFEKYEFFFNFAKSWDEDTHLTRKAGETINQLLRDDSNVTLAIHRTYLGPLEEENGIPSTSILQSIMEEGLINNGHAMQGAKVNTPHLALTTTPISKMGDIINLIGTYKGSNGTILLAFPKDKVDKDLNFINNSESEIYRKEEGTNYIRKEYIVGAILKQPGKQDEFYTRDQITSSKTK